MSAATGIEASRARGARLLAWAIWAHVPVLGLAVWAVGGPAGAVALLAALTAAGVEGALRLSPPAAARLAVAAGLAAQPMLLTAGFAGHPWQVDTHMHYFAVLAMLALMTDLRAVLAGAGLIAVHHLSLNFLWPAMVYPGGADLGRTLLHAVIVVIETAVLAVMILDRQALDAAGAAARAEAEAEAANARALEAAQRAAEAERGRERAEADALLRDSVGRAVAGARRGDFSGRLGPALAAGAGAALHEVSAEIDGLLAEMDEVFDGIDAHLAALGRGDFAVRSERRREGRFERLRTDMNATSAALADLAEGLGAAVARTDDMADEIDRGAAGAARRAEAAAASIQETSATMEQISASVAGTADRLGEAERMAGDISARTGQGAAAAREAVAAVARIESSSTRISEIISVIDAIAFQTNLLALNAAVEAARAGEAGKGFAVVAAEVRGLAQRSSDAARDIAGLIKDGAGHVADGVRLVQAAGGSLDRIAAEVDGLADAIAQIAAAGREQAQGVTEINAAVADLDGATQANAAEAEAASALAARLRAEVATLTDLMARLSGPRAGTRPARAA